MGIDFSGIGNPSGIGIGLLTDAGLSFQRIRAPGSGMQASPDFLKNIIQLCFFNFEFAWLIF